MTGKKERGRAVSATHSKQLNFFQLLFGVEKITLTSPPQRQTREPSMLQTAIDLGGIVTQETDDPQASVSSKK